MGKTRNRESLIRMIANTIVHRIVVRHTRRPESSHFLDAEIIEYHHQAQKAVREHHWNSEDKFVIEEKALRKIQEKLAGKYSDVEYTEQEVAQALKEFMQEVV